VLPGDGRVSAGLPQGLDAGRSRIQGGDDTDWKPERPKDRAGEKFTD